MSIFETIGLLWVIFTSALATAGIMYLSYIGLKVLISKDSKDVADVHVEVKEMFKVAH